MAFSHELVAECLQFEQAFCTAACPFSLDIRDFIGKLQQGRFNIAYKTYQNATGFPGIVSALCPEPCQAVCPMKDAGGAISLKALEKAAIAHARSTDPDRYNVPPKEKRIAVIGAGISGLACALRLASRKYRVTVFEKSERIGGHLYELLPEEIFLTDIALQFKFEQYSLVTNTEITNLEDLSFDAIYVATGKGGRSFGLTLGAGAPFATSHPGVFAGGSLAGADSMTAIVHGLNAANAIETWLKIGSMHHSWAPVTTKLPHEVVRILPSELIHPSNGSIYSKEEAIGESKRCLKCCCDACNFHSPLMSYFRKFPKRITEEVQVTITPSSLDGAAKLATRYISACMHCGLCREVCPKDIDTGEFLLQSHRTMRRLGQMPWAFHEFYLRDMAFSMGEAGLARLPDGCETSRYLFFPGCQLGASNPEYVIQSYRFLLTHFTDTSLLLGCCGAPAEWAGEEAGHAEVIARIYNQWEDLGRPVAILACPSCAHMFRKYLPEIPVEFLYSILQEKQGWREASFSGSTASVYDPCTSRHEPLLQDTIRKLATGAGFALDPLPMEGRMAECCSYGGQVAIAHPPYAENMIAKRIGQKNTPYITYCSNCRDIFAAAGKETFHILDILFGIGNGRDNGLSVSDRQRNRLELKKRVLTEFWNEEWNRMESDKKLVIPKDLQEKLHKNHILESDLLDVVEYCERSGKKLYDPDRNSYTGHRQIGHMTFWVEYRLAGEGRVELVNGYCHRLKIEE
ncbi:MAG TPA: FAD-dependent oxidoreductase [Bacteroidales bacterium]|nr:FAD-dependent oxidoreductase [Bacteroidales bacterium]HPS62827.1 FAD-dependent oxidoreductase [Bacteroidales bacterium]